MLIFSSLPGSNSIMSKFSSDDYLSDDDLDSQVPLDSQPFISTLEKVKKKKILISLILKVLLIDFHRLKGYKKVL